MSPWQYAFLAVNLLAFCLMGIDKGRAGRGRRRIAERTLFFAALLGGALGGTAGMLVFHHKTQKARFAWGLPLLAIAQMAGVLWVMSR